ncbi:uncharacterized protein LOC126898242 [Daktulosphaira vitifoliae]|uniref:uncharacterized protein LOC126898242 n=1 Tax=Daktulosphaira vitifoliae TaxID=58002 RepID=UPI0021AAF8BE|nr:uncharacterized protein LOC126898242 [Daktulosphaira vitifoliae]
MIWDHDAPSDDNCNTKEYDVLYEGPANLVISKKLNDIEETHTYIVQTDKIAFVLKKTGLSYICSIEVVATEHNRLLLLLDPLYMSNFKTRPISVFNTDLVAYMNTKFVYIENFLSSTVTAMYTDLVMKQCHLERQILKQKLAIASYSLSEFAYSMTDSPGFASLKSGEIIYLLKCKPVKEIQPPQTLMPEIEFTWQYKSPEFLMNAGLYSKENMNLFQRQLLFPQEINAAQSNMARETLGYTILDQGLRFKTLIDEMTINKLVENKLEKIYAPMADEQENINTIEFHTNSSPYNMSYSKHNSIYPLLQQNAQHNRNPSL